MIYIYTVVKNGSETLSGSLATHFLLGNVGMDTHGNRSLAQESQTRVAHLDVGQNGRPRGPQMLV